MADQRRRDLRQHRPGAPHLDRAVPPGHLIHPGHGGEPAQIARVRGKPHGDLPGVLGDQRAGSAWGNDLVGRTGATDIAVSDSRGATWNAGGLDVAALRAHKLSAGQVAGFPGGTAVPRDDIIGFDCELLVPAAQPDVVTIDNAAKISARVILQGANIPVTAEAEAQLAERGVLCVPDVIANAGGVICAAAEYHGAGRAGAFAEITEKIRDSTTELLDRLRRAPVTPRAAAGQMAHERLRRALALRRRF